MFYTRLCQILDIKYPIIQGGMAWAATHELAQAVSNAGGLGVIAAGNAPKEVIREEIRKLRLQTDKPFGVNIMLMSPFAEDIIDLVCEERVPVVTTGAGNPGKYIERLKNSGIKVLPVVPTVALARRLEREGVDALIVEGTEAGGHIGELTTMAIVPQITKAVDIPVVAAGVQMGTRFVCSTECIAHQNYKERIVKAKDRDAIVTGRSTGYPVRVLKNKFTKEYIELEKTGVSARKLEELGAGRLRIAVMDGDIDNGSVMAGQIAGMIEDVKPCEKIINNIIEEAEIELNRLNSLSRGE